jgi:hypothetical protein
MTAFFGIKINGSGRGRPLYIISTRHGAAFWLRFFFGESFGGLKGSYD